MDDHGRRALLGNIVSHAGDGVSREVQRRVVDYWSQVDQELGRLVGLRLGLLGHLPDASNVAGIAENRQAMRGETIYGLTMFAALPAIGAPKTSSARIAASIDSSARSISPRALLSVER